MPLVGGFELYLKPLGSVVAPFGMWRYANCLPFSRKLGAAGISSTVQPISRSFSAALVAALLSPPKSSTNAAIAAAMTSAEPSSAAIIFRLARGSRRSVRTIGAWTGRFGGGGVFDFFGKAGRW